MVDLPVEEAGPVLEMCNKHELAFVPLIAPTSSDERIETLSKCVPEPWTLQCPWSLYGPSETHFWRQWFRGELVPEPCAHIT